jgi:hypothetical protein
MAESYFTGSNQTMKPAAESSIFRLSGACETRFRISSTRWLGANDLVLFPTPALVDVLLGHSTQK